MIFDGPKANRILATNSSKWVIVEEEK